MNCIQESENYEIVGKEFCNLFDKYGADDFFFGLIYLLSKYGRIDEINKDFANKMSSVLGLAKW